MSISNLPPKGTADWFPDEFAVRKYIFDTWRKVCVQFGYQEYLTPLVEDAEVYRAKSGDEVGGRELTTFTDRAGREMAIRPEMTPSVTRMVSRQYEAMSKPIRLFSIANFFRNEKPQRGRNREFWQLNADIFGVESVYADLEILQLAIALMQEFKAPAESYVVNLNDRRLIEALVVDYLKADLANVSAVTRVLDKFAKLERSEFVTELEAAGAQVANADELAALLSGDAAVLQRFQTEVFAENPGMQYMQQLMQLLGTDTSRGKIAWDPGMVRGFDYYDGMVFEVFDTHPDNNRSLFGGGRYNGLAGIFGKNSFPAVGFAPGDETTKLFLEGWNLVPSGSNSTDSERIYVPLLSTQPVLVLPNLMQQWRQEGKVVVQGLEWQRVGKALEYADKNNFTQVVLCGDDELARGEYVLKNLRDGSQTPYPLPV